MGTKKNFVIKEASSEAMFKMLDVESSNNGVLHVFPFQGGARSLSDQGC